MKDIAVIGSGTMGNGIAHVFAQQGYAVQLVDISRDKLDKGMATILTNLERASYYNRALGFDGYYHLCTLP